MKINGNFFVSKLNSCFLQDCRKQTYPQTNFIPSINISLEWVNIYLFLLQHSPLEWLNNFFFKNSSNRPPFWNGCPQRSFSSLKLHFFQNGRRFFPQFQASSPLEQIFSTSKPLKVGTECDMCFNHKQIISWPFHLQAFFMIVHFVSYVWHSLGGIGERFSVFCLVPMIFPWDSYQVPQVFKLFLKTFPITSIARQFYPI